jgi:hypothetical protein
MMGCGRSEQSGGFPTRRGEQLENRWQHAAKLLLEACEIGDAEAATKQLEFALFMSARLALQRA